MHRSTSRELLGFDSRKRFHQAAFATCGIVFVDNTFLGGLIQAADRSQDGFFRGLNLAGQDRDASIANCRASCTTHRAVKQAALFVLKIAFDLGLNVSQGNSSEKKLS
jgi:hypothetical protein